MKLTLLSNYNPKELIFSRAFRYAFSKKGESIHEYRRSSEGTDHRTVPRK